ncbi:MAG: hypothetical protein KQJ78_20830 [Deltaproteobacteria bacterium]|nr:hypothetical protein [Deltaproteobacteria bacterium]
MEYCTELGEVIDTDRDLNAEERNFLQKMFIYEHLKMGLSEFQARWRREGNPVWQGPDTLKEPGPAARIVLDLERKIGRVRK